MCFLHFAIRAPWKRSTGPFTPHLAASFSPYCSQSLVFLKFFKGPKNQGKKKQGLGPCRERIFEDVFLHPKNDQAMICVILVCRLLPHKVEICIMFRKPNLYSTTNSNRRWPIDQKSISWTMEHIITNGKLTVYHSGKSLESYIRLNHTGNPSNFARLNGLKVSTNKHNLQLLHAEDWRGGASKLKPSFHEIKSVVTRVARLTEYDYSYINHLLTGMILQASGRRNI